MHAHALHILTISFIVSIFFFLHNTNEHMIDVNKCHEWVIFNRLNILNQLIVARSHTHTSIKLSQKFFHKNFHDEKIYFTFAV